MDIREILMNLDALDDDQWTADGAPKIASVSAALGETVTRQQIVDAAPGFTRENMVIDGYGDNGEPAEVEAPDEPISFDEKGELEAEKAELESNVSRMTKELESAKARQVEWIKRLDEIADQLLVLDPPMTNAERARNFINASNEARLRRHGVAALIVANLPKEARTVGTPLDNAFARRNRRGGDRPTR